jgi:phosphatidylserine/phosphatidylglycerophosphate/cardiolipin synthase-like enzyme
MSAIYNLLDMEILTEQADVDFMETPLALQTPFEELDALIRQSYSVDAPPEEVSDAGPEPTIPEAVQLQGWQLAATLPRGVPLPEGAAGLRASFVRVINSAAQELRISSPYLEGEGVNLIMGPLEAAAGRGVSLRVLVRIKNRAKPNLALIGAVLTLNNVFGNRLQVRSYHRYLAGGQNPAFQAFGGIHSKIVAADASIAYVGSGEVRDHSLNRNFELGFVIADPAIAALINSVFDAVWDISDPVAVEYCRSFVR